MTTSDRIISELIDALNLIRREAENDDASRHYIQGVVKGATDRCNASRERNSDGYLVVKTHSANYDFESEAKRIVDALELKGATMTLVCALREAFTAGSGVNARQMAASPVSVEGGR